MQIPHEAIADAVRVRLKLDANRYERNGPLSLVRELLFRTGTYARDEWAAAAAGADTHKSTCFVGAKGFAIMKRAGGIKPR